MTEGRRQERAEAVIIAQEIQTGKLTTLAGLRPCRERAEYGANWPSAFHLAKLATVLVVSIEELYLGPDPDGGQP